MRTSCYLIWTFILTLMIHTAHQKVMFVKRTEGQSVDITCTSKRNGAPVNLFLTHTFVHPKKQVLFMANDGSPKIVRVNQQYEGRLKITGRLNSDPLNVTISTLNPMDTGLYVCEFFYTADPFHQEVYYSQEHFLFVEGTENVCRCSRYPLVLYAISAAAALLILILIWLCTVQCVKRRKRRKPKTPIPIYEEMNSGCEGGGSPKNNHPVSSHLEETNSHVYANYQAKQPQENYYASPRKIIMPLTLDGRLISTMENYFVTKVPEGDVSD
ncbi:uncharacterized protein LOC105013133 [Esox lucius]|uniref:Immunoglobulin V-set domain-containing protein n=1 Tax=Esox lucius TaxID=8010 RepID=A0AAY5LDE2_ESOLU|nr:uncharacterized protein LOC105013133 [Esox lucius]